MASPDKPRREAVSEAKNAISDTWYRVSNMSWDLAFQVIKVCFIQLFTLVVLSSDFCIVPNPPDGHIQAHEDGRN